MVGCIWFRELGWKKGKGEEGKKKGGGGIEISMKERRDEGKR